MVLKIVKDFQGNKELVSQVLAKFLSMFSHLPVPQPQTDPNF